MSMEVLDMVDPGEELGMFEIRGESPYFEPVQFFRRYLSAAVFIGKVFECGRIYWYVFGGKMYESIVGSAQRGRRRRIDASWTRECKVMRILAL